MVDDSYEEYQWVSMNTGRLWIKSIIMLEVNDGPDMFNHHQLGSDGTATSTCFMGMKLLGQNWLFAAIHEWKNPLATFANMVYKWPVTRKSEKENHFDAIMTSWLKNDKRFRLEMNTFSLKWPMKKWYSIL